MGIVKPILEHFAKKGFRSPHLPPEKSATKVQGGGSKPSGGSKSSSASMTAEQMNRAAKDKYLGGMRSYNQGRGVE